MVLIESIRQMMAGEHYSRAEEALENALINNSSEDRIELVALYLECLILQKKNLPDHLVFEVLNPLWDKSPERATEVYTKSSTEVQSSTDSEALYFRMKLAEKRGHIQELHNLISAYQIRLYERSLPRTPELIERLVSKYFRTDFQLRLQTFALSMLRKDFKSAEEILKLLILEAFERSSPKILREKLESMVNVISVQTEKGPFEIYQSLLQLYLFGFQNKKDFKRLAEVLIYFDDFRFNVMVLHLLHHRGEENLTNLLVPELIDHPGYDFVYIAKHFPELKHFFVAQFAPKPSVEENETPDLTLENGPDRSLNFSLPLDQSEDEELLIQLVRTQDFDDRSLLDLAVSFLQSDLPVVAIEAASIVQRRTSDPAIKLKAAYLALTSLLLSGDYRRAIDLALESLQNVSTTEDLLSFLYCEAEAYLRLNMKQEARQVLKKIVAIDSSYRMARERLEKLE